MKSIVHRYADRVSISFAREGETDHDFIYSMTFDLRVAAGLDDQQIDALARTKLKEVASEL